MQLFSRNFNIQTFDISSVLNCFDIESWTPLPTPQRKIEAMNKRIITYFDEKTPVTSFAFSVGSVDISVALTIYFVFSSTFTWFFRVNTI